MSFSPTAIGELLRRHYPRAKGLIQQVIEAMQMSRTQGIKISDIDIVNRVIPIRSKVRVEESIDNAQMNVSGGYPTYYPATEPNGTGVKLYLFLDHLAQTYKDYSGFERHAQLQYESGVPEVDDDGPDLGNGFPSRALRFDSAKKMALVVPHSTDINVASLATGFSLTMRVRFNSFTVDPTVGRTQRLWSKYDDANNEIVICVTINGKLEIHVKKGGAYFRRETTNIVFTADTWHTITIVYAVSGPALTLYVDGASKPLTTTASTPTINSNKTSLFIGSFDNGSYMYFDGIDDLISIPNTAALQLSQFSIMLWFRNKKNYEKPVKKEGMMIIKGRWIGAPPNLSYGLWISERNDVRGGFETAADADRLVQTSDINYYDGKWHSAAITFNGTTVRLYIDGTSRKSLTVTAGDVPEVNTAPLIIGANDQTDPANKMFYQGDLDDIYVWQDDLTGTEILNFHNNPNSVPQSGDVVYSNVFSTIGHTGGGQVDGNIQWVMYEREDLYTATEALAIHNNKWTKNPDVGSNKVAQSFFTLATTA